MKAVILNSGKGTRMGEIGKRHPKCMSKIAENETILSNQLKLLAQNGIRDVVITTGAWDREIKDYCQSLSLPLIYKFVKNELYDSTNYIYSIYLARTYLEKGDILLMHGDLVFEESALQKVLSSKESCVAVSSTKALPQKDFKAVLSGHKVHKIGIQFFENAVAAQPLYKLNHKELTIWMDQICAYCESGDDNKRNCYAENAFNDVAEKCDLKPIDVQDLLCSEVDTPEDLQTASLRFLPTAGKPTVYMCFSTDTITSAHLSIMHKAQQLGQLIIGVLSDEAVMSYKRFPLLPFEERKTLFENIAGVYAVVEQKELSYQKNIERLMPSYVVHGDDWVTGFQRPIREEVIASLTRYGGQLVEYPYATDARYQEFERRMREELALPDIRRSRLKKLLEGKGLVTALEAHSGITGLIVEKSVVNKDGKAHQFDAMWISSLCDSTAKGKPDIELVDMTSRFRTIDDIMEVTTKPIIFDGDTGGLAEHFVYTVRTLERMGVSMVIIEDKTGVKKNSLFGTEVKQTQDSIENFSAKIAAGKRAQKTKDFMICARIESLILEKGQQDALKRAKAYAAAGADAIMIHSRRKEPDEIFEFVSAFRNTKEGEYIPIVVVPTSFNSVTEEEFKKRGVNIVIYANQLTRSGFPAMQRAAECILENHRALECDEMLMSIKEIINLIPER